MQTRAAANFLASRLDVARGVPGDSRSRSNFGGQITTASGLVFIGEALDNYLRAFYRACPALNNGDVGAILDLRPLFERFGHENGTA